MLTVQIIDDDQWVILHLEQAVKSVLPEAEVMHTMEPSVLPGCDIYLIDNQFGAERKGMELVRKARAIQPEALVIVFSGNLERREILALIDSGCDAIAEKGDAESLQKLLGKLAEFSDRQAESSRSSQSLRGTIRAMRQLLVAWNHVLDKQPV